MVYGNNNGYNKWYIYCTKYKVDQLKVKFCQKDCQGVCYNDRKIGKQKELNNFIQHGKFVQSIPISILLNANGLITCTCASFFNMF